VIGEILRTAEPGVRHRLASERWEELTAEALSAAALVLTGRLPGARVEAPVGAAAGEADAATLLGREQGVALAALCLHVCADEGRVLDEDLRRFLARDLVHEPALELLRRFEQEHRERMSPRDRYVLHAVHASACAAAGVEDPLLEAWASHYMGFGLARLEAPEDAGFERLRVAPERAQATLSWESLWDAAAAVVAHDRQAIARVSEVCAETGFATLVPELLGSMRLVDEHTPLEAVLEAVERFRAGADDANVFATVVRRLALALVQAGRPDDVAAAIDRALELADDLPAWRGPLLSAFGAAMKEARRPHDVLDRLGEQAADWERELPADDRAALWTERSNALRLLGRPREARAIAEAVHGFVENEDDRRVAELNLAILLRETGEPDRAAGLFEGLLPRCAGHQRLMVLDSLMTTYNFLGRHDDMERCLREAVAMARGPWASEAPRLRAALASLHAARGEADAAIGLLDELREQPLQPQVLANEVAAYAMLAERGLPLDATRVERALDELRAALDAAAAAGDRLLQLLLLQALCVLLDVRGDPDAERWWRERIAVRGGVERADPLDLVSLARLRWLTGDHDEARALLCRVPAALAHELGASADVGATLDATARLGRTLRELTAVVLDAPALTWADLRLLAELQRDGAGRARLLREALDDAVPSAAQLADGLGEQVLARLAPERGTLHVVEWLRTPDAGYGLVTRIRADGAVVSRSLTAPAGAVGEVAERLRARLDGWRPGRAGDPLDFAPWQALEAWLLEELGDAGAEDHVVFIDHVDHAGLPWHAVAEAPWTASYAPSWSALLALVDAPAVEPARRLGVLSVPARGDGVELTSAFARSLARSEALAAQHGLRLETAVDEQADRAALVGLLGTCDLVKLQCHGFLAADDHELALMLADAGDLPLQHTVAAAAPGEAGHRFSWRDAQRIDAAPALVLSAACSSGASLIGGLGERCGMYGALRLRGTRAVVAPAWDGVAEDVLALLDDVIARRLRGEGSLAACVKAAGEAAQGMLPRWRAWTLALEGDWR
jgi:tetratricopeptide (TPR) repeat protein